VAPYKTSTTLAMAELHRVVRRAKVCIRPRTSPVPPLYKIGTVHLAFVGPASRPIDLIDLNAYPILSHLDCCDYLEHCGRTLLQSGGDASWRPCGLEKQFIN